MDFLNFVKRLIKLFLRLFGIRSVETKRSNEESVAVEHIEVSAEEVPVLADSFPLTQEEIDAEIEKMERSRAEIERLAPPEQVTEVPSKEVEVDLEINEEPEESPFEINEGEVKAEAPVEAVEGAEDAPVPSPSKKGRRTIVYEQGVSLEERPFAIREPKAEMVHHRAEENLERFSMEVEGQMLVQRRIFVTGKVQGVSFRSTTAVEVAQFKGVRGWVKNLDDGRVEAVFLGEDDDVTKIIEWCRRGPELAEVTHVEVLDEELDEALGDFRALKP